MAAASRAPGSTTEEEAPDGFPVGSLDGSESDLDSATTKPTTTARAMREPATHWRDRPGRDRGAPRSSGGSVTDSSYGSAGCRPPVNRSADLVT
jgi:hypothetical protein